jgi:hypothetical protein
MKKEILLEIQRTREIMGLKPLMVEEISLSAVDPIKIEKILETLFDHKVDDIERVINRNSKVFELGTEKLEEKLINKPMAKNKNTIIEEFLEKASTENPEKFFEMINKLSDEIIVFAYDLAELAGGQIVTAMGTKTTVYEILEKTWESYVDRPDAYQAFDETADRIAEKLNIPKSTMDMLKNGVQYGRPFSYYSSSATEKTLEKVTENELEDMLAAITDDDMTTFLDNIVDDNFMVVSPDGTLNVKSETLMDYCINGAPNNVKKYFRAKFKLPETNIPIPFTNIPGESRKLIEKELEFVRGSLLDKAKRMSYEEVLNAINKQVERKLTPTQFQELMSRYCFGTRPGLIDLKNRILSGEKQPPSKGWKGFCRIVANYVFFASLKYLIVDLNMPVTKVFTVPVTGIIEDAGAVGAELIKDLQKYLSENDTEIIQMFYKQHPESNNPNNSRFNPEHHGYFEVRVNTMINTADGEQEQLSDWLIVKHEGNGVFTLEDAATWWEETKEKVGEEIDDKKNELKSKVDSVKTKIQNN